MIIHVIILMNIIIPHQILHYMQPQQRVIIQMNRCITIKNEFVLIMNIIIIIYLIMKQIYHQKNMIFILQQIIIIKMNIHHIVIHRLLSIVNSILLMDGMERLLFDKIKLKVFLVNVVCCCYCLYVLYYL